MPVVLTGELVESFAGTFLSPMYDSAVPTPQCHREWWDLYCSNAMLVGIAAPRAHAKSTALTHDYSLANVCFQVENHVLVVSATEELALAHLGDIAMELRDNDDLRSSFNIKEFETDSKSEIVVRCGSSKEHPAGYVFRMIARGAGQKLRGLKWRGRRPGLIICDDMEEDEQVENFDRRKKFRSWVLRALLPLGRKGCKIRWHGTILHEDSYLARIMKSRSWISRLYKAHDSFDDFSNILWPEMWDKEALQAKRQVFIDDGDAAGYSQEYLNDPFDNTAAFLKREDFLPMTDEDFAAPKQLYVGCDFAVSTNGGANRTSFTIGGLDATNLLHIIDQRVDRWDALEWIDEMFAVQREHRPAVFFVEGGVIWKSISPMLYKEMQRRNVWINCLAINPTRSKAVRGQPLQKRMRAKAMRFAKEAHWYPAYEVELLHFSANSDALLDDQFDSTATLVKGLEDLADLDEEDFMDDDELLMHNARPNQDAGRSVVTGY
jgi:predicted phage terminase large subunit-like protein